MMRRRIAVQRAMGPLLALGMLGTSLVARASEQENTPAAGPLGLTEVLASAYQSHPDLDVATRYVEAAEGKRLQAAGGWDPRLSLKGKWTPLGYYDYSMVDASVVQATPFWGAELHAGYRRGVGKIPDYKGELETLRRGEVRAGILVPLWKGGPIDGRRAATRRTAFLVSAADCDQRQTLIEVGRKAAHAYFKWVAAGQEVRIQRELLTVAEARAVAFREQIELGLLPSVMATDNRRLLLERQGKLLAAQQYFRHAALGLSLYYRDAELRPVVVEESRMPATLSAPGIPDLPAEQADLDKAMLQRPELCSLEKQWAAAQVDVELTENQVAPKLDANAFVARDMGDGPAYLQPTEVAVGVAFELPLALRAPRGKRANAQAKAAALKAKTRGTRDKIAVEVRKARLDVNVAAQQLDFAQQQVVVARKLVDAERDKMAEGASDLVVLNLREVAAADAARLQVDTLAALQTAWIDYQSALGEPQVLEN